jgi:hypothetical protein
VSFGERLEDDAFRRALDLDTCLRDVRERRSTVLAPLALKLSGSKPLRSVKRQCSSEVVGKGSA